MPRSGRVALPVWVLICAVVAVFAILGFLILTSRGRERENAAANPQVAVSSAQRRGPEGKPVTARPTPAIRDQVPVPLSEESRRLLAQVPKNPGGTTDKEFLEDLLKLKEREKRDNALIHYVVGIWSAPEIPNGSPIDTAITQVLNEGWSADAECLRPYLAAWQPGFREIRKGVALDFAHGVGFEKGYATPLLNFLNIQYAAKGLCVEGCLFESEGRYSDALDNYLAALAMGRDFTSPGSTLISDVVGYSCENTALERIRRLVAGGRLDAASLDRLLARLGEIEKTLGSPIEAVTEEQKAKRLLIHAMKADPKRRVITPTKVGLWDLAVRHDKRTWDEFWHDRITRYKMTHNLDRAERDLDDISALQIKILNTPWWEYDWAQQLREMDERIEHAHILVRMGAYSYLEPSVQFLLTQAALRACRVSTAVAAWIAKHGAPPAALRELQPDYFPNGLPVDPFSGKDFLYSITGGKNYHLSSPGPDKAVGGNAPVYDPTNGTVSRGDILFAP